MIRNLGPLVTTAFCEISAVLCSSLLSPFVKPQYIFSCATNGSMLLTITSHFIGLSFQILLNNLLSLNYSTSLALLFSSLKNLLGTRFALRSKLTFLLSSSSFQERYAESVQAIKKVNANSCDECTTPE